MSIATPPSNPQQYEQREQKRQRDWAWVWLAYTGFIFIEPIMVPSLSLWLATLSSFACFLVLFRYYVRCAEQPTAARHVLTAAIFALGLACFPWNQGSSTFFIYAAGFLPFTIPSARRVLQLFALMCVLVLAEGYYFTVKVPHGHFHTNWINVFIGIFLLLIVGGSNIFAAQQKRSSTILRLAQEENLALAAVAERERIARDLHDVLGHTLSVIVLKAELAGRLVERDPARATAEIGDVERTARTALAEVREAIGGYRSRGLAAEIEAARLTLDAAGVTLLLGADTTSDNVAARADTRTWAATHGPTALTPAEETMLALALREAVTNIVRHARATTCRLHFISLHGHRRLIVEDNGQNAVLREGNGLRGMRERVESLGGRFALERDNGTRLLIDLPLRESTAR